MSTAREVLQDLAEIEELLAYVGGKVMETQAKAAKPGLIRDSALATRLDELHASMTDWRGRLRSFREVLRWRQTAVRRGGGR